MIELMSEIINFFCSFVEAFMISLMLKTHFTKKRNNTGMEFFLLLLVAVSWGPLNSTTLSPLGFFLGMGLMLFYSHYMLDGKIPRKIIVIMLSLTMLLLTDFGMMLLVDLLHLTGDLSITVALSQYPEIRIITMITTKIIFTGITMGYIYWYKIHKQKPLHTTKPLLILSILCFLALITITKLMLITLHGDSRTNQLLLVFCMLIALFYILVTVLLRYLYHSTHTAYLYQSRIQKDELQKQHGEEMRLLQEELETWKANAVGQLTQLQKQIEQKQYHDLAEYWRSLEDDIYQHEYILTGNETFDIILNQQLAIAKQKGIHIQYNIQNVELNHIQTIDMISLLSNLLSNAMEAAASAHKANPKIYLQISKNDHYITIKTENPYDTIRVNSHGKLLTTKKNAKMHGRGISSMQTIASRYHGTLHYEAKEHHFTTWIILSDEPEIASE